MRADEVMTRAVVTVHADDSVQHAAALLTGHGITSVPVLDADGGVIGIVSEIDLIRNRMPHDRRSHLRREGLELEDPARLVRDVMSDMVICLPAAADLADIAELMLCHNVRAVPIVDAAGVIGIVSRRDLLRTLLRKDGDVSVEVCRRLDDYAGTTNRWRVAVTAGVVTVRGHFDDDGQREIVTVLARTVPGVSTVHLRRGHLRRGHLRIGHLRTGHVSTGHLHAGSGRT